MFDKPERKRIFDLEKEMKEDFREGSAEISYTGDKSHMPKDEVEEAVKRFREICERKRQGSVMIVAKLNEDDDGMNVSTLLYSNRIPRDVVHRAFHDAIKDNRSSKKTGVKVGTLQDLLKMLGENQD